MPYYNYKKSICSLDGAQVASALEAAELAMRSSKAAYVDAPFFKEQADEIKKDWPPELTSSIREMIKTNEGQVGPRKLRKFSMDAIRGAIPGCKPYDRRLVAAETTLATLFRRAPDWQVRFRSYRAGGPVIGYKVSLRPSRMVIDTDKVDQAELFVYFYYCEEIDLAMALGYATQEDVRNMPSGNMYTLKDCMWKRDAHFKGYKELRPMIEFCSKFHLQPLPSMSMFEFPPDIDDIPLEPNRYLKTQIEDSDKTDDGASEDEKFLRDILGIKDKSGEKSTEAVFDL